MAELKSPSVDLTLRVRKLPHAERDVYDLRLLKELLRCVGDGSGSAFSG
jgi:hypothetical protein